MEYPKAQWDSKVRAPAKEEEVPNKKIRNSLPLKKLVLFLVGSSLEYCLAAGYLASSLVSASVTAGVAPHPTSMLAPPSSGLGLAFCLPPLLCVALHAKVAFAKARSSVSLAAAAVASGIVLRHSQTVLSPGVGPSARMRMRSPCIAAAERRSWRTSKREGTKGEVKKRFKKEAQRNDAARGCTHMWCGLRG